MKKTTQKNLRESLFALSLLGAYTAILRASSHAVGASPWIALQALLSVQAVLLFHDCLHGSAFGSPWANVWIGRVIGGVLLWPFGFLRQQHLSHHRNAGLVDHDPEALHCTQSDARTRTGGRLLAWLARTPLAPFTYPLLLQGVEFARWCGEIRFANARLAVLLMDLAPMTVFWSIAWFGLFPRGGFAHGFIWGYFVPGVLGMGVVYWVSKPLHTDMLATRLTGLPFQDRNLLVTRTFDLPRLARSLVCNLNYHIEHHLKPGLSRWDLGRHARARRSDLLALADSRRLPLAIHSSYWRWHLTFWKQGSRFNDVTTLQKHRKRLRRYQRAEAS